MLIHSNYFRHLCYRCGNYQRSTNSVLFNTVIIMIHVGVLHEISVGQSHGKVGDIIWIQL